MKEIIQPELDNFLRDIGVSREKYESKSEAGFSVNARKKHLVNKLFYEQYKDTVWFNNGKLFKVVSNSGELETYELAKPETIILEYRQSDYKAYKYFYWLLLIVLGIVTFKYNYNSLYIAPVFLVLFFLHDRIFSFYYKVRFFILKR